MSAHSPMRRTSIIFVVVLMMASAAATFVAQAQPVRSHRKAAASSRGAHKTSTAHGTSSTRTSGLTRASGSQASASKAGSYKSNLASTPSYAATSSRTYRHSRWRRTSSTSYRAARYVPAVVTTERSGASGETGTSTEYKSGYEAGRAAALEQMRGNGADYAPAETESDAQQLNIQRAPQIAPQTGPLSTPQAPLETSPQVRPQAGPQALSVRPTQAPADDASEVEVPATRPATADAPEIPEGTMTASLNLSGAGLVSPLRGSLASLTRQNTRLDADGLERIEDEADLTSRIEHHLLVPLPASAALIVNPNLSDHHRYCRSWTARFLADLARTHEAAFHKPIEVNSAVRTVEYQRRLMYVNGNAAPAVGDIVSPHLTGATIDIAKQGLNRAEMAWMRSQLLAMQNAGKIDVEEEFEQACFHITVYKSYVPARVRKVAVQDATTDVGAAAKRKATQPKAPVKPASQLPADLAVGGLAAQG